MEEESIKNFINSIIFLVKLFTGLKDKFLAQKLYDKISGFIAGYIELSNSEGGGIVAQYSVFIELKNSLDGLLELLDYLEHSKSVSVTPLLYARRNLLDFKLNLVKSHHQTIQVASKSKENEPPSFVPKKIQPRNLRESSNKERIFSFIKHSPNSRTKEIIEEFNILSERTVKRNLKELTTEGLVRRWAKDKGVYYIAI